MGEETWGTFKITPSTHVGPDGWKLTVKFSEPIRRLEVWQARILSKEKAEFVLENRHCDEEKQKGFERVLKCHLNV